MHKFLSIPVVLSLSVFSLQSSAYNLFSLKLEGGFAMTPDGMVLSNSTLLSTDTDNFSARWVSDNKVSSKKKNNQSLLNKNKTDNSAYAGVGVITRVHPAIPIRGELLFSYYPKYKLGYHGTNITDFPTAAKLTSELERYTVFANMYGDLLKIKTTSNIIDFFVQGGVGAASNNLKDVVITGATDNYTLTRESSTKTSNSSSLAWNLGLGANVSFDQDYTIGIGYRYVQFDEAKSSKVALYTDGTWDNVRNPFNIKTYSHLFYISAAFA